MGKHEFIAKPVFPFDYPQSARLTAPVEEERKIPPVAILSQGPRAWASSRIRGAWLQDAAPDLFRWYQPDEELALAGYKVLVFQKRFRPEDRALMKVAQSKGVKIVIDLTDPLWWFFPNGIVEEAMRMADVVTVSNPGLKAVAEAIKGVKKVVHIADRMLPSFHPTIAEHGPREIVTLVWFGLAANRIALMGALPILAYAANRGLKFRLRIIDDQPTERIQVQGPFDVEHVPWTLETIHAQLTACDIALLPPYPGPWGDMKSNNKEVTAWWCGLPTTDGYNANEVGKLIDSADIRKSAGGINRNVAEEQYDISQSVTEWRSLLDELGVKP